MINSAHLRKHWMGRVRCYFNQTAHKKLRSQARAAKAAAISPRPLGLLRPVVASMTQKYAGKQRLGRGFTFAEVRAAGLTPAFARTVGIAVDHRRKNKSEDAMALNVARLNAYKSKLVLFPRRDGKAKKGQINDATDAQVKGAKQNLNAAVLALPARAAPAPEFVKITKEMSSFNAAQKCRDLYLEKRDAGRKARKAELAAAQKKAS